tara:strand:+ start:48 stop:644 length:597 start_codon:yes stop_codon:yes gene_type:complete
MGRNFYNQRLIIVISSPSGTGKTSVCNEILRLDDRIKLSVSYTTREPRDNEKEGKDYFFISHDEFKSEIKNDSFLEYAEVFGNFYGSSFNNVDTLLSKDFDVLFDIDWQGANQVINSKMAKIVTIFLVPPSKDTVLKRLKKRSEETGDDNHSILKRMQQYEKEISHSNEYDFVVTNDNFKECVDTVISIINDARIKLN